MIRLRLITALLAGLASLAGAAVIPLDAEIPYEPAEGSRPLRGLTITIDPGHGGSSHTEGYSGSARGIRSRVVEGDLNSLVASQLYHYLRRGGAQVHLTRRDDQRVTFTGTGRSEELGARVEQAVDSRSHLFLALHHNSAPRRTADGVVVLIWPTDSQGQDQPLERAFADILREEVEAQVHHREEFPHYLSEHPLVMFSDIPSAVIEFGFLSNPEFDAWVSQPGAHRAEARGVYNAIVRMWREHGDELEALRTRLFPRGEDEVAEDGEPPMSERRARRDASRLVRSYWPSDEPPQTARELQFILDAYRRSALSDATTFRFDVRVEGGPGAWRVSGSVNHPRLRDVPARLLAAVGCSPEVDGVRLLPAASLGAERYGVCAIPMALTYPEPYDRGTVQTQLLLGDRVYLLDEDEDRRHFLLMAPDGYLGWVRQEAIRRMDAAEFTSWSLAPRARVVRETMVDDFRVPAGSALPVLGNDGTRVRLRIPRAVRASASTEAVMVPLVSVNLPSQPSPGFVAAQTAITALTVPYVFGGRSMLGLDCSGLVGNAYLTAGLRLPRDARQQMLVGEIVATPWYFGDLRPGDILFFIDGMGHVTHVGLSLGGSRFIHESPPEVQVSSFDPGDPLYAPNWAAAFCFARRPLD